MFSKSEVVQLQALSNDLQVELEQTKRKVETLTHSVASLAAYEFVFGASYLSIEEAQSLPPFNERIQDEVAVSLEGSTKPYVALYMKAYRELWEAKEAIAELTAVVAAAYRFTEEVVRRDKSDSRSQSE